MLTPKQKKRFRTIGHTLNPVVTIAANGLTEPVKLEIERALTDHELIKLRIVADRADRKKLITRIQTDHNADLVQAIGGVMLVYRPAKKPNPALSNVLRSKVF